MTPAVRVIDTFNSEHVAQLHALYQNVWWAKGRTLEDTARCVAGSQLCVGLVDEQDRLVGFTRVLTDSVFKALLFDVIVADNWQGHGLGRKLIQQVKGLPKLRRVKHFELYCLPEMFDFYRQFGFTTALGDVRLMRCESPDSAVGAD